MKVGIGIDYWIIANGRCVLGILDSVLSYNGAVSRCIVACKVANVNT